MINNEIHITFWKKTDERKIDAEEIFSFSTSVNPNYVEGQKLFLKFTCYPLVPDKFKKDNIRLTEFKIIDIHQFVNQTSSGEKSGEKLGTEIYEIPFSIQSYVSIDIYVKEIN